MSMFRENERLPSFGLNQFAWRGVEGSDVKNLWTFKELWSIISNR